MIMAAVLVGALGVTVMENIYYVEAKSFIGECASGLKNASSQFCHDLG